MAATNCHQIFINFPLKNCFSCKAGKSYGIIIKKNKNNQTKYPLIVHLTELQPAKQQLTRGPQNLIYGGIYKQNGTGHFQANCTVVSRRLVLLMLLLLLMCLPKEATIFTYLA